MGRRKKQFALVVSRFNEEVTAGLLRGAVAYLKEQHAPPPKSNIFYATGAFEIPLVAQTLARTGRYAGIICLGCVIKGETAHFEYISSAATLGLMQVSLTTGVPISLGILTAYTDEQALRRSSDDMQNKGREAAAACLASVDLLARINADTPSRS